MLGALIGGGAAVLLIAFLLLCAVADSMRGL